VVPQSRSGDGISASVFDAIPFPAFIVDDDVRVLAANPAAGRFLGQESSSILRQRGGEVLHCINSSSGCGKSAACPDCVIRGAARFALAEGQPVRRRARLECVEDGSVREMHALITASPVVYDSAACVLLFIEDLTLLFAMTDVLPICMGCKKVLNNDLWLQIEAYLDAHLDLKFTHGLCPDCSTRLYPDTHGQGG
jgi:PAS domain-containing protein